MDDLKSAVQTAFGNVVSSGAIEAAIEKQLASTIASLIQAELREYSDFGKAIKECVQQAVCVNLDRLDLPSYNELILQIIRRQMDAALQSDVVKQLEDNMAKLLVAPPAEITMEALIEAFVEHHKEDKDGDDFTLLMERKHGTTYISLDEDSGKSEYSCDYRLAVDRDGKVYSLTIGTKDVAKTIFTGPFYNFERMLFQLYAAKTKLIIAPDEQAEDFDTSYPCRD